MQTSVLRRQMLVGLGAGFLGLSVGSVGCVRVVHVAEPPSPLRGIAIVAAEFDYKEMTVEGMSREAWLAKKTAEDAGYPKTWDDLIADLEGRFDGGFRRQWGQLQLLKAGETAPAGAALLTVKVNSLAIGHYIPFATSKTRVETVMQWSVDGKVAHVEPESAWYVPSMREPSVFQHVRWIGNRLGESAGRFMRVKQR